MLKINIAGKQEDVKFNFKALFRANNELSSSKEAKDGAGQLWMQFVTGEDMAAYNALCILLPKGYSDEQVQDAIDEYAEQNAYDQLIDDLQGEMKKSSFFRRSATHFMESMEKVAKMKTSKNQTQQEKMQAAAVNGMLEEMKKSLS